MCYRTQRYIARGGLHAFFPLDNLHLFTPTAVNIQSFQVKCALKNVRVSLALFL